MPVVQLGEHIAFPPANEAEDNGLLAVGGDLSSERLLLAYERGIFPWYEEGLPILWHSPDPRMVLKPSDLIVGRTLRKTIRKTPYTITLDTAFEKVISKCSSLPRPDQDGTWITEDMKDAYCELHRQGFAHSVEAWLGDELVGGLYGVSLGSAFFGESMFATQNDASKISFVYLVHQLQQWGFQLIDCQVHTEHLERFGAAQWDRDDFLAALAQTNQAETRRGPWRFQTALNLEALSDKTS